MTDDETLATEAITHGDPFAIFAAWYRAARAAEPNDANAMALATATRDGAPSLRMVLLKGHGPDADEGGGADGGFIFYTNSHSRKGTELAGNPQVALLFHWKSLRRQVRIEGPVSPVGAAVADAYFASRARDSQLGALASDQSAPLASRNAFLARYEAVRAQYEGHAVPRPEHWLGYRVCPEAIEFWVDRPHRLHERRRFIRDATAPGGWTSMLLYP